MLNTLNPSQFVAAINQCDIFLDSIGWSGCNSTMESLACNLPIVTTPGPLMRGCHSSAILQMMGVTETIAGSAEDYISIAERLANNPDERRMLSCNMAERESTAFIAIMNVFPRSKIFWITRLGSQQPRPKSTHVDEI